MRAIIVEVQRQDVAGLGHATTKGRDAAAELGDGAAAVVELHDQGQLVQVTDGSAEAGHHLSGFGDRYTATGQGGSHGVGIVREVAQTTVESVAEPGHGLTAVADDIAQSVGDELSMSSQTLLRNAIAQGGDRVSSTGAGLSCAGDGALQVGAAVVWRAGITIEQSAEAAA